MNKRSATLIAATLVGVLAIAGATFSLGITGATASAAAAGTTTATDEQPKVPTETNTAIVHRLAPSAATPVAQDSSSNSGPSVSSGPGHEGDDDEDDDHIGPHDGEGQKDHDGEDGDDDHGDDGDHDDQRDDND